MCEKQGYAALVELGSSSPSGLSLTLDLFLSCKCLNVYHYIFFDIKKSSRLEVARVIPLG